MSEPPPDPFTFRSIGGLSYHNKRREIRSRDADDSTPGSGIISTHKEMRRTPTSYV